MDHRLQHSGRLDADPKRLRHGRVPVLAALLVAQALALASLPSAHAATPATILFEGALLAAGGPVVDGEFALTVRIYADANAKDPLWSETHGKVAVSGGRFVLALGAQTSLEVPALAAATAPFLGVQVGAETELPRQSLHSQLYARWADSAAFAKQADTAKLADTAKSAETAKVAQSLACTGCVPVSALLFDGDVDLGGHALKAGSGSFAGALVAKSVSAQSFIGDGSKLTGIVQPQGVCKSGEAVVAIAADGSVQCKVFSAGLPANGLAQVSNGALSNEFTDTFALAGVPIAIPDNTGASASGVITVPDIGLAQSLTIAIELSTSDLSNLAVVVLPPDDKKVGYVLCDPCGEADAKSAKLSFDADKKPKVGDLAAWMGKSPAGTWTFKVTDSAFCIAQKPGNLALCDVAKLLDGAVVSASITVKTTNGSKVEAKGALLASGGFRFPLLPKEPFACDAGAVGFAYLNTTTSKLMVCNGIWRAVLMQACGNGAVETGEACDDGVNNSDSKANACRTTCQKASCGDKVVDSGEFCDDGNQDDNDGCKNSCQSPCKGWAYKGICLMASNLTSNQDAIPAGCTPYQPATGWGQGDYLAICQQFMGPNTNCAQVDTDGDGGLCSNFQAILSWESNGSPDVWLRNPTFSWNAGKANPNCNLYSADGIAVYACK